MRKNKLLLSILIFGFLIKIIYTLFTGYTMDGFGDAGEYNDVAMSLLKEHTYPGEPMNSDQHFIRPPFYPFFLYILYLFSPQNYLLVNIAQAFLMTIAAFLLFKIAMQVFSENVSIVSAAIFSFHPYFIVISGNLQSESVFLFCTILALYFLLKFERSDERYSLLFLSGIFSGLSILTKPSFAVFLPLSMLWLLILKRDRIGLVAKSSFVLCFSCFLVLSPWIARNLIKYNEFMFSGNAGGLTFFLGNSHENYERITTRDYKRFKYLDYKGMTHDHVAKQMKIFNENKIDYASLPPKTQERLWYDAGFLYIKSNKIEWLKLLWYKMLDYLRPWLHPWHYPKKYVLGSFLINAPIFLFGIIGLVLALGHKESQKLAILFILYFLAAIAVHTFYVSANRYRIVYIDPYLYIFASYAFLGLIKRKV